MYRYRLIPGITVVSNMRWRLGTIIVVGLGVAFVIYLAAQSDCGAASVKSALRASARGSSLPLPPHRMQQIRHGAPISSRRHPKSSFSEQSSHNPRLLLRPKAKRRRLTKKEKEWVLERYNHHCARCRKPISDERLCDYDHTVPLWATALPWVDPESVQLLSSFEPLHITCHRIKTQAELASPLYKEYLRRRRLQRSG